MTDPSQNLASGAALLGAVLGSHFVFKPGNAGRGSGGVFAAGSFSAEDRSLSFSVRYGLGLVTYSVGAAVIEHADLLRYAGLWGSHRYPNFGGSIEDSFRALADDLANLLPNFVSGDGSIVQKAADEKARNPRKFTGFSALNQK